MPESTSHPSQPDTNETPVHPPVQQLHRGRFLAVRSADYSVVPAIYAALMLVVFSVIGLWLLVKMQSLLVLLFISLLLATSIAGPVRRLESWGVKRGIAILIIYLMILAAVVAITWFAVPPLIGQVAQLVDDLPNRISQFERLQERFASLQDEYPILTEFEQRLTVAAGNFGSSATRWILSLPTLLTLALFVITSILTLSFLMLTSWSKIKPELLRLIRPENRELTEYVLTESGERMGAYMRAKVIVCTIVGIWMYVTVLLLGSPIAIVISIFAAMCEIVPKIGPLIGRMAIVIAMLPLGWKAVLIAFLAHFVIDNIKGSWLSPLIEGRQVEIHPLTAFIAVIGGGLLLGWIGALIAVPVAAVVQVVVEEVIIPWRLRQLDLADKSPVVDEA